MILLMNVDKDNPSVAEGESVQIQGAGLTGFEPKGNTEQDTLTGKNLFDGVFRQGGRYTTSLSDTNRLFTTQNCPIKSGVSYTISTTLNTSNFKYAINLATVEYPIENTTEGNAKQYYDSGWKTSSSFTFTPSQDGFLGIVVAKANGSDDLSPSDIASVNWQLEQGSSATSYEPYVGGIPSPNPDYPQEVKVVTGNNTIKVENNVFDINTITENTYINENGETGPSSVTNLSDYILIKPSTICTLTYEYSTLLNTNQRNVSYYDENKNFISAIAYYPTVKIHSITTPSNAKYLRFSYDKNVSNIRFSTESQTYPINLGTIELRKIGTYQDYIYKENNKWYKHSEIGKVVLDGSENWQYNASQTYFYYNNNIFPMSSSGSAIYPMYSTHFISNKFDLVYSGIIDYGIAFAYNANRIVIRNKDITSSNDFKIWLSTHNTAVYYVLATPTNTEITDTELKEDLEAISNIALFEGVNNISMESSNLTSSFKVYYDIWYEFDKILRNGYNIREDRDRITQKFANGHRKQFVSDYVDCSITLNLDTIDKDTTQDYLQRLKSGAYKYYSIDGKEYRTAQFIIENKPELSVENSISNNVDVNEYQITLLKAGD